MTDGKKGGDRRHAGPPAGRRKKERIGRDYYDGSDYFDGEADHLHDLESPFQQYRIGKVTEIYDPGPEEKVLDLGCGWGTFGFALADQAAEVVGVDFSERSIELCRERLARSDIRNLSFRRADAGDTELESDSFDVVIAADLFEHVYPEDATWITKEAHRVLKRGGRLVIWTPHRGHIIEILRNRTILLRADPTHVDYKSMARLRAMLNDAGFVIEKAYYAESHLPVLRHVERGLMAFFPFLRRRIAILGRKI